MMQVAKQELRAMAVPFVRNGNAWRPLALSVLPSPYGRRAELGQQTMMPSVPGGTPSRIGRPPLIENPIFSLLIAAAGTVAAFGLGLRYTFPKANKPNALLAGVSWLATALLGFKTWWDLGRVGVFPADWEPNLGKLQNIGRRREPAKAVYGRVPAWNPAPLPATAPAALGGPRLGQVLREPSWFSGITSAIAAVTLIYAGTLQKPRSVQREGGGSMTVGSDFWHIAFLVLGTAAGAKTLYELSKAGI